MTPKFTTERLFSEQLAEWKRLIEEYRRATNKDIDDEVKVAIITSHAPSNMRSFVSQAAARCGSSYLMLEKELLDTEVGSRSFTSLGVLSSSMSSQGAMPMEIGVVGKEVVCQICSKRGHDAKTCWQRSAEGKGFKHGKGKGKDKGKPSKDKQTQKESKPQQFAGKCNFCHKVGHMAKDCRKKAAAGAGQRSVGAVGAEGSQNSPLEQQQPQVQQQQGDRFVCVVTGKPVDGQVLLCVDSGAEEHCGPSSVLLQHGVRLSLPSPVLRGVSGQTLRTEGVFALNYKVTARNGEVVALTTRFVACEASKFILSVDRMVEHGIECCFTRQSPHVVLPRGCFVDMIKESKSFYLPVVIDDVSVGSCQLCPVGEGDKDLSARGSSDPMPASSGEPMVVEGVVTEEHAEVLGGMLPFTAKTGAMRDRLRKLGAPIYGTKEELYSRLRDAELMADKKRRDRAKLAARATELAKKKDASGSLEPVPVPPGLPDLSEIRKHYDAQHLPPAHWCEVCIKARSVAAPHFTAPIVSPSKPRFEMDYNSTPKPWMQSCRKMASLRSSPL
eukprot:6474781-Amphidinium_carterae.1